jgi:hypothetical protein
LQAAEVSRSRELVRNRATGEQRHKLELRNLKERTDLVRDRAILDVQAAQAFAGRLRQELNLARQDALRCNQERNAAQEEIVELRTQHLATAVRTALAPVFPLSAE